MLNAVQFVSNEDFEKLLPSPDIAVISISNPGDPCHPCFSKHVRTNRYHTLSLEFLDLEPEELRKYHLPADGLCGVSHIRMVLEFVDKLNKHKDLLTLVIHCRAGVSLSPALALIVQAATGCWMPRKEEVSQASPHILSLAKEKFGIEIQSPTAPAP